MRLIEFTELLGKIAREVSLLTDILDLSVFRIKVGGSVAMKLQLPKFDREIHDIDIIVNVHKYDPIEAERTLRVVRRQVEALAAMNRHTECGSNEAYSYIIDSILVGKKSYPVNVILETCQNPICESVYIGHRSLDIQPLEYIKWAKQTYKPIRIKDVEDVLMINEYLYK